MPAPHPPEFRRRAVELARLGEQPIAQVAKDLGISESCLRNWMGQADADDGTGKPTVAHLLGILQARCPVIASQTDVLKAHRPKNHQNGHTQALCALVTQMGL